MRRVISALKRGTRLRLLALSVLTVVMLFGATGCFQKLNGGGWMESDTGVGRATFAIHVDGDHRELDLRTARGTYQDKAAGVSIKFDDVVLGNFTDPADECADYSAS